jgi:hypothetical protein
MQPWQRLYEEGRACPEPWLESKLRDYDPKLRLRFHRYLKCWCVTRKKSKPGRVDEDLVEVWRHPGGERKQLTEKLLVEIKSRDTWKWGPNPAAEFERRAAVAPDLHRRRVDAEWRGRALDASREMLGAYGGRPMVARP